MKFEMKKITALILVFAMLFGMIPASSVPVFAGGLDDGSYGPIAKDDSVPYMVVVEDGSGYKTFKSSSPIWFVHDDSMLVSLEAGATIKEFIWSVGDGVWKEQAMSVATLNSDGVFNIDSESKTYTADKITDVAGVSAGEISGEEADGTPYTNSYGDNLLNHNTKLYNKITNLTVETKKDQSQMVADSLDELALGLSTGDVMHSISSDLTPVTSGTMYGLPYTISWSTNKFEVLDADGSVNRQKEDINVQLTASVKVNGTLEVDKGVRTFNLTVKGDIESDLEKATRIVSDLTISDLNLVGDDTLNGVDTDFVPTTTVVDTRLVSSGGDTENISVTWSSSDSNVLEVVPVTYQVNVKQPLFNDGDKYADLTASVDINGEVATKYFRIKVLKQAETADSLKIKDLWSVSYDDIAPSYDYMNVISNFSVPTSKSGTDLTWSVVSGGTNASVDNATGLVSVTRPASTDNDVEFIMEATATGVVTAEKMTFYFRILRQDETQASKQSRIVGSLDRSSFFQMDGTTKLGSLRSIDGNFKVATLIEGETIVWTEKVDSPNISIVGDTVTVNRKDFGTGNEEVTLVATSGANTKEFNLLILQADESTSNRANRLLSALGLDSLNDLNTTNVISDFNVKETFGTEAISWDLDSTPVSGGLVVVNSLIAGNKVLTATIDGESKSFNINKVDGGGLTATQLAQKEFDMIYEELLMNLSPLDIGLNSYEIDSAISFYEMDGSDAKSVLIKENGQVKLVVPSYIYPVENKLADVIWTGELDGTPMTDTEMSNLLTSFGTIQGVADKRLELFPTITPVELKYDSDGDGDIDVLDGAILSTTSGISTKTFNVIIKGTGVTRTLADKTLLTARQIEHELVHLTSYGMDYRASQAVSSNITLPTSKVVNVDGSDVTYTTTWGEFSDTNNAVTVAGSNVTVVKQATTSNVTLFPTVTWSGGSSNDVDASLDAVYPYRTVLNGELSLKVVSTTDYAETTDTRNARIVKELDARVLNLSEAKFESGLVSTDGDISLETNYNDNGLLLNNLISWSSSDVSVIANDGTVVYPSFNEGDTIVTLTATIGSSTRDFNVLVKALSESATETDERLIADIMLGTEIKFNASETIHTINNNLDLSALPVGVTMSSSVPTTISDAGIVTVQPSDSLVTLTFTKGSFSKTYIATVIANPRVNLTLGTMVAQDNQNVVNNIINDSFVNVSGTETFQTVESPFTVDIEANYKGVIVPITWSDNSANLNIDGSGNVTFTQPAVDEDVILTATVGGESKTFNLKLIKYLETDAQLATRIANEVINVRELGLTNYEPMSHVVNPFTLHVSIPEYPTASISWDIGLMPASWRVGNLITPIRTGSVQSFNLTATVDVNGQTATKVFAIDIPAGQIAKDATAIDITSNFFDGTTRLIEIEDSKPNVTSYQFYGLFNDADGNPVGSGNPALTWEVVGNLPTDIPSNTGISIDANGLLSIDRNTLINYRNSPTVDNDAMSSFKVRATSGVLTQDEIDVSLIVEIIPAKGEGELIYANSFEPVLLYLGRYAPFETAGLHEYRTLINYGEYQLMYYSDIMPKIKSDFDGNYLGFDGSGTTKVNLDIYKAVGSTEWVPFNHLEDAIASNTKILFDVNSSSIEYINYDLKNALNTTVLRANINSNNVGVAPEYKSISLPSFTGVVGTNKYIFSRGLSNYFMFASDSLITFSGNTVNYPSGNFYTLVQDRWVLNDTNSVSYNDLELVSKSSFSSLLKYSSVDIASISLFANIGDIIHGTPNYMNYVLDYPKDVPSNDYIVINTIQYGVRALEFPTRPTIDNGRIKFSAGNTSGIKEKAFIKGVWTSVAEPVSGYIDANGYYLRKNALGSLIYSTTDLLDSGSTSIINSAYSSNISFYSELDYDDKLPITAPPTVDGLSNKIVTQDGSNYKAYYSKYPFYQNTSNIVLVDQPTGGSPYNLDVYDYSGGSWVKNTSESIELNTTTFPDLEYVVGNIASKVQWTNTDIRNSISPTSIYLQAVPESVKFSTSGGILPITLTDSYNTNYPYAILDRDRTDAYWLARFNSNMEVPEPNLVAVYDTEELVFIPKYSNWKKVLIANFNKDGVMNKVRNTGEYDTNGFTFLVQQVLNDLTNPIIDASYIYKGVLHVIGRDQDATDPLTEVVSGLSNSPYGFKFMQNITLPYEVTGLVNNLVTTFPANTVIPANTTVFFSNGQLPVDTANQPMQLTLSLVDKSDNWAEEKVLDLTVGQNNVVLFGADKIPQNILDAIDEEAGQAGVDRDAPAIYGVYMYRGELYILGEDLAVNGRQAVGLNDEAYGFKWNTNITPVSYGFDLNGRDAIGNTVFNEANKPIPHGFELYKQEDRQAIGTTNSIINPSNIIVKLRDKNNNIASAGGVNGFNITQDSNNNVVWENPAYSGIPDYIKRMLETERNKNNGGENVNNDKTPPEITGIYILEGRLQVLATDNVGLAKYGYGFEWNNSTVLSTSITDAVDIDGNPVNIASGTTIPSNTEIFRSIGSQNLTIPTLITVSARDGAGNVTEKQILVSQENEVLFGEIPEGIKDLINKKNGDKGGTDGEKDNEPPTITAVYTYKGKLYIEGFDDVELANAPYGWNPLEDMIILSDYVGEGYDGYPINILKGQIVSQYTEIYKSGNAQEIMIPMYVEVILRDKDGNETREKYFISKDNWSFKGDIPDGLEDVIGGDDNDNTDGDDLVTPIDPNSGDENGNGAVVKPDSNFDKIDWSKYDYVVEVLDKDTERVVYKIKLDKADDVIIPRLEDSETYKLKQDAVSEQNGDSLYSKKVEYQNLDRTPPVITKVDFSNGKLVVEAYDKGGLAEKPYNFVIEGARNQDDTAFSKDNFKKVFKDERVLIKVVDKSANVASIAVDIQSESVLRNVNINEPYILKQGETKSKPYWVALLKQKFNLGSQYELVENNFVKFEGDDMTITGSGVGVLRLRDTTSGMFIDISVKTLNAGRSGRTIVVQEGSSTNLVLAFRDKLMEEFGTINGLVWYADNKYITRNESMFEADSEGVGKIVVSKGDKSINLYSVVAEDMGETDSMFTFQNNTIPYTLKLDSEMKLSEVLKIVASDEADLTQQSEYIVLETKSKGVEKDGDVIKLVGKGRKNIQFLNVVKDEIVSIDFEVIELTPHISTFTDTVNNWSRGNVEFLTKEGIIESNTANVFKPNNSMTVKEFLMIVNKLKTVYLGNEVSTKQDKEIPLSEKELDYFNVANALIELNKNDIQEIFGKETNYNRAIKRIEAVQILSRTVLAEYYHSEAGVPMFSDVDDKYVSDINHLLGLKIISGESGDAFRPKDNLTRAEMSALIANIAKYLK